MNIDERINTSPESPEDVKRINQIGRGTLNIPSYDLNESPNSDFARAVDDVSQGHLLSKYIKVGTTPEVLKMLGLSDVRVTISGEVLHKVMQSKHNVTAETLKQLPSQINNPVAVMKSETQSNGYVVLTDYRAI